MVAKPIPPTVDGVPRRQRSTTSSPRPSASKICAPRYPSTVEIPIFDRIFSTPSSIAAWSFAWAVRRVDLAELAVVGHRRDRPQRDTRADRVGAVAEQARDRVRVACVAGVDDERRVLADARRDQRVVHRTEREQRRDGHPVRRRSRHR